MHENKTAGPHLRRPRARTHFRLDVLLGMVLLVLLLLFLGFSAGAAG